ncbi:MAG TPA: DUF4375 domain-containing protein [Pseudolabrys sp.]|jgi:hypothetical protein
MPYESDPITAKLNGWVAGQELYYDLGSFEYMNAAEKALIGTWELVNEVYNGGFMQYFHNSSREHAKPMIVVLRSFEATEAAEILETATALAGPGTPLGDEPGYLNALKMAPDEIKEQLSELESKLYNDLDNVHLHLFQYLKTRRDEIEAPEDFWTETT